MKRILSILVAAVLLCSCFAVVTSAAPDLVHTSVEGTATIDGTKDDIYASGLVLPIIQCGTTNGGGALLDAAIANAYIVNDASYVYWFVEVYDETLDNTSANNYEQDSIELFYMADNSKTQIRFCYDGNVSADTGVAPEAGVDYVISIVDGGYTLEYRMPITDVLNNQVETTVQVNYCADAARAHTTYIEGNAVAHDAYQRTNRQTDYDVWWTLALAGTFEDNRVDPEPEPMELKPDNYMTVQNIPVDAQLFAQDQIAWSWIGVGAFTSGGKWNVPLDLNWEFLTGPVFDETTTNNWTVDPKFRISIGNGDFLAIAEDAVEGDTGDTGDFVYNYSDIVITAEGYEDVIVPAGSVDGTLTVKMEAWGKGGNTLEIDLVAPIKEQLGLDTQGLCTYLAAVSSVKTSITLVSYNLVDQAVMDAYLVQLDAEDEALIVELQEYADKVAAALETANGANGDVAVLQEAADEAQKAVNRATKEAEGYTKATEWAKALQESVDQINDMIAAAQAPAEEETPVETPTEDEKPADDKPADAEPAEGGSAGIVIAIVAVVVIAVVVVIILVSKKKK